MHQDILVASSSLFVHVIVAVSGRGRSAASLEAIYPRSLDVLRVLRGAANGMKLLPRSSVYLANSDIFRLRLTHSTDPIFAATCDLYFAPCWKQSVLVRRYGFDGRWTLD